MTQELISVYKSSATPFPLGLVASVHISPFQDTLGITDHYQAFYSIIADRTNDMNLFQEDIDRLGLLVIDTLTANMSLLEKCRDGYLKHIKRAHELLNALTLQERLSGMSNKEVAALFAEAAREYHVASAYAEQPGFALELGGQIALKNRIKEYLEVQKEKPQGSEFEKYFSSIINPTNISFVQEAELALLNIALLPKSKRKQATTNYLETYYWKLYDYHGPLLDEATFEKELEPFLNLSKDELSSRVESIHQDVRNREKELQENLKKYPLPKELSNAARAIREISHLYSDIKKQHTSRANVGFGELLKFLGEKYHLNSFLLHYATYQELLDLAGGTNRIDEKELKQRTQSGVVAYRPAEKYYEFLTEDEAKKILTTVGLGEESKAQQLKGMPANSGLYTGPARVVINVSQIGRVQKGDVLVAPMTTVGYVPAMKKAGAIITDIGGITSHAAIVSRELGVPCIVGLKTATTSLTDGDLVEVNANHGIVRVMKEQV